MNELKSDEVPQKFAEWLLAMGCHPEVVPPDETVAKFCRGYYYMVWRSLMKKVHPKDVIRKKRLQVFCDDIRRCQKKNVFSEREVNTVVPEELLLWRRHTELKKKVADAEARVRQAQEENHQKENNNNNILCQRYLQLKRLQNDQRQALLMQQLSEKLRNERASLLETRTIAESLCGLKQDTDVKSTLDKCMASLMRQSVAKLGVSLTSAANPAANSTVVSITSDSNVEEVLSSLAGCDGELLFKQLYERRAGLCAEIPANHPVSPTDSKRARSVVCHSESLYCSLSLAAVKNKILIARTRDKLAKTFMQKLFSYETRELLVSQCEVACSEARTASIRDSFEQIAARSGAFAVDWQDFAPASTNIHSVDKVIESKRNEIMRLITLVAAVELKTLNVRERLLSRFNSFHGDLLDKNKSRGAVSLTQESMSTLRQFYEDKRDEIKKKQDISLNLDKSDTGSFNDVPDNKGPTFIDELKFYLNKFDLEKNRKIVLENGRKIWIFESTRALLHDIHTKSQTDNISSLLLPCATLKHNLHRLMGSIERKEALDALLQTLGVVRKNERNIDLSSFKDEEQKILDVIKKRLNENILSLQKTSNNLDGCMENMQFWADNCMKKYISDQRKVAGRSYMQHERAYLNSF